METNTTIVYLTHTRNIPDSTLETLNDIYRGCQHKTFEYETGLTYTVMKSVKMDAFIRCVKHAYSNGCDRMVVLTDDFRVLSDIKEAENYDAVRIDTGIGHPCWSLSKEVIESLYRVKTDSASESFESDVMKCINSFHVEQMRCVEHLVDYVVTYVDDEDPVWREQKKMFNKSEMRSRFSSLGLLDTHLTLVRKNLPFINNVYVVVSSESQLFNVTDTEASIVLHNQIIDKKHLPTFNSSTIEMSLPKIPGLSEHVIYANDDMYTLRELQASDFFKDGHPRLSFHCLDKSPSGFYSRCSNSFNVAASELQHNIEMVVPEHTVCPMLLSSCEHVLSLHKNKIEKSITRFRDKKNINQYVFSIYDKITGKTLDSSLKLKYCALEDIDKLDSLIDVDICCLNDTSSTRDRSGLGVKINKLIESTIERSTPQEEHKKASTVVYTCITGGYDNLRPVRCKTPGVDYICFTDDITAMASGWQTRPIPDSLQYLSKVKQQRYVKTHPHELLKEYSQSIWVDGSVDVIGDVNEFIAGLDKRYDVQIQRHPQRDCIYAEAVAVKTTMKDTPENVDRQIEEYKAEGFPEHYGLSETNVIYRQHNTRSCIKLMEAWWDVIEKHSHRDQLSLSYVLWKLNYKKFFYLPVGTNRSKWFNWNSKSHKPLKFCIVHYNTSELTSALIASIRKQVKNAKIYVMDNSDKERLNIRGLDIVYYNNTDGRYINFDAEIEKYPDRMLSRGAENNFSSAKHSMSIQKCIELINDDFILLDSDVLLKKNPYDIIDKTKIFSGELLRYGKNNELCRVLPFICYINARMMKRLGLKYHDPRYMHGLRVTKEGDRYDTGANLYRVSKDLPYKEVDIDEYIVHYRGGSWEDAYNKRTGRDISSREWLDENAVYWK